jgi:hypothetical protein
MPRTEPRSSSVRHPEAALASVLRERDFLQAFALPGAVEPDQAGNSLPREGVSGELIRRQ